MEGPFSATSALNSPSCDLPSPAPGARSSVCAVDSTQAAAASCAAACLASAECTAYTWHANASSVGVWALACVFRLDGAWAPVSGAADHVAGRKVAPPPWPVSDGFERLPTMWFGANASGLDSPDTLALIARHRIGAYGWQQGTGALAPGENLGAGDALQAAAATHLSDFLDARGGANRTLVGVYRQVMIAQQLFAAAHSAAGNPNDDVFWLRNESVGDVCVFGMPWGTLDPVWNFSVPAAADFWVDEVVGALATEAAAAGVRAVFFDDSDYNFCSFWSTSQGNCAAIPVEAIARWQADSNAVLGRTAAALNAAGIIPIFSSVNVLATANPPGPPVVACALPEDAMLAALAGTTFARFYEFFPSLEFSGPDVAAVATANAILEGAAGVPVITHFPSPSCPSEPRNITRPGRLGGAIEFELALFLVTQSNASVFSISNDWFDANYCWHSEFDVAFGAPLAPALRTGAYTWTRAFSRASVAVDVSTRVGTVDLLA